MGYGDDIMATAHARQAAYEYPEADIVFGNGEQVYWSEVFENNPNLTHPRKLSKDSDLVSINEGPYPLKRGYVAFITDDKLAVHDRFKAREGDIFLTDEEQSWARKKLPGDDWVMIEPNVKGGFTVNKAWPFDRWQEVVNKTNRRVNWVQCLPPGAKALDGVRTVKTETIRDAFALLARCRGFAGTDGALHHAAAAFGIEAVVLWSHYSHPKNFGYDWHKNLRHAEGYCGNRKECPDCKAAMERITVDEVVKAALGLSHETVEMQQVAGVWLPAKEDHLRGWLPKRLLLGKGTYQLHTLEAAMPHVDQHRRVIDIGAHCGLWSMHLRHIFDKVEPFEPVPQHRACFRRNVPGIEPWPYALGPDKAVVKLVWEDDNTGHTHIGDGNIEAAQRRLDSFRFKDVDLIKIDCEGYEKNVLIGAEETIKTNKPTIVVEQKPHPYFEKNRYAAVEMLTDWGMVVKERIVDDFVLSF